MFLPKIPGAGSGTLLIVRQVCCWRISPLGFFSYLPHGWSSKGISHQRRNGLTIGSAMSTFTGSPFTVVHPRTLRERFVEFSGPLLPESPSFETACQLSSLSQFLPPSPGISTPCFQVAHAAKASMTPTARARHRRARVPVPTAVVLPAGIRWRTRARLE